MISCRATLFWQEQRTLQIRVTATAECQEVLGEYLSRSVSHMLCASGDVLKSLHVQEISTQVSRASSGQVTVSCFS